jgi:hypothetical protein
MNQVANEVQAICRGLIAGARYGIKIRLPHAAVMTLLFRRELSAVDKLQTIAQLVAEHATNLAAFACLYKSILAVLKWASQRRLNVFLGDFGKMFISMLGRCCCHRNPSFNGRCRQLTHLAQLFSIVTRGTVLVVLATDCHFSFRSGWRNITGIKLGID